MAILLAFGSAVFSAISAVIWRYAAARDADLWAIMIYLHFAAVALALPILHVPPLLDLHTSTLLFLFAAASMYVSSDLCSVYALRTVDTNALKVSETGRLVLIAAVGVFVFDESFGMLAAVGSVLIAASIVYRFHRATAQFAVGWIYLIFYAVLGTVAVSIDKYLINVIGKEAVVFYGFMIPGCLYALLRLKSVPNIPGAVRITRGWILLTPLASIGLYLCAVGALALGQLSTTYLIQQTSLIMVFVLEMLIFRNFEDLRTKFLASIGCGVGAALVCIGSV